MDVYVHAFMNLSKVLIGTGHNHPAKVNEQVYRYNCSLSYINFNEIVMDIIVTETH